MAERPDTLVFVPAWNEEESLPAVLEELRAVLPEADVVVVDDGSTDRTAEVARSAGADVVSLGRNRGLPTAIGEGYRYALERGYAYCGRVDADGQHPAAELRRLLERVRSGSCDVAVGSRFAAGEGYPEYRYRGPRERELGQFLLRRLLRRRVGRAVLDPTSGMYAAGAAALPVLARPYEAGAPEVEGLIRLAEAGLRVEEVPADMRERAGGASKLTGKKALVLVLTVTATVLLARRRRQRDP